MEKLAVLTGLRQKPRGTPQRAARPGFCGEGANSLSITLEEDQVSELAVNPEKRIARPLLGGRGRHRDNAMRLLTCLFLVVTLAAAEQVSAASKIWPSGCREGEICCYFPACESTFHTQYCFVIAYTGLNVLRSGPTKVSSAALPDSDWRDGPQLEQLQRCPAA